MPALPAHLNGRAHRLLQWGTASRALPMTSDCAPNGARGAPIRDAPSDRQVLRDASQEHDPESAYPLSEKSRTYKELDHDDDSTKRHHDLAARQFSPVNLARKEGLADGTSPPAHLRMVR